MLAYISGYIFEFRTDFFLFKKRPLGVEKSRVEKLSRIFLRQSFLALDQFLTNFFGILFWKLIQIKEMVNSWYWRLRP